MSMVFIAVKEAAITTLGNDAAGAFRVLGFQAQEKAASNFKGNNQMVEVFYKTGTFPKGRSRNSGPVSHEMTLAVELTTSAATKVDLAVLENPASTPAQLQAALGAAAEAALEADKAMDDLISRVFQIMMSGLNLNLGLDENIISDRWILTVTKNDPNPRGQLVVLTAAMNYNCTVSETVPGEIPIDSEGISLENDLKDDAVSKQGFSV